MNHLTNHTAAMGMESTADHELEIAALLADLSAAQDEILLVLAEKRDALAVGNLPALVGIESREEEVGRKLEECQRRREKLLRDASAQGLPSESVGRLADSLPSGKTSPLRKQVREASSRMRLVQNQALTNWVIAQRSLLHLSQLLAIIAAGGRLTPTYGAPASFHSRGALVDQEA